MATQAQRASERIIRIGGLLLGCLGVAGLGLGLLRRRFQRTIDGRLDALDAASTPQAGRYQPDDVAALPDPVQRYFQRVLEPEQAYATAVKLHQSGSFRLGDAESPWRPMDATQYYTTMPPGFVWDASIQILPMVHARVLDAYVDGSGVLDARVLSALQVANAGPSPELNEGELLRYLAEAVWFPTALLPTRGIEWTPVDSTTARATLTHRNQSVAALFHFGDDGLVERVTADRYRDAGDEYVPWTGYFRRYERRNGRVIPTAAEVEWNLDDGDLPYWRATIDRIDHRSRTA